MSSFYVGARNQNAASFLPTEPSPWPCLSIFEAPINYVYLLKPSPRHSKHHNQSVSSLYCMPQDHSAYVHLTLILFNNGFKGQES